MRNLVLRTRGHRHPFSLLTAFENELIHAFPYEATRDSAFNYEEKEKHYLLSLDLPGVSLDDISITTSDKVLKVSGERKDKFFATSSKYNDYRSFEHTFKLPEETLDKEVQAHFENGVLLLAVPKKLPEPEQEIKITSGPQNSFWLGMNEDTTEGGE